MRIITFKTKDMGGTEVDNLLFTTSPYTYKQLQELFPVIKKAVKGTYREFGVDNIPASAIVLNTVFTSSPSSTLKKKKVTDDKQDITVERGNKR